MPDLGRRAAQPRGLDEGQRRVHRRARGPTGREEEITWGVFGVPEASLGTLGDVAGLDVVELGCGTAYVSAWLARRGARPVGVDVTPAQLATARRCQAEFGLEFPLVEASAEDVPLPVGSFDLALSEYGASIWCDPYLWIPEAHRLLRPGGRLWFLRNSTLSILCAPDEGKPTRGAAAPAARASAASSGPTSSASSCSCRTASCSASSANGVRRARPRRALRTGRRGDHPYYDAFSAEWARKWPAEEIWVAREAPVTPRLVLASTSPQRRAILEQLRIPFTAVAPAYVEHDPPDADPVALVREHAEGKARSVHRRRRRHAGRRHDGPPRRPRLRQARRREPTRARCSPGSPAARTS